MYFYGRPGENRGRVTIMAAPRGSVIPDGSTVRPWGCPGKRQGLFLVQGRYYGHDSWLFCHLQSPRIKTCPEALLRPSPVAVMLRNMFSDPGLGVLFGRTPKTPGRTGTPRGPQRQNPAAPVSRPKTSCLKLRMAGRPCPAEKATEVGYFL